MRGPDHTDQNPKRAVLSSLFSVTYVLWCGRVSVCAHARLAYVSSRSCGYPLKERRHSRSCCLQREERKGFSRGGCRPAHSLPLHPGAPSNAWQRASPRGSEVTMLRRMQTATNLVPGMKVRPPPKRIATTSLILAQGATCSASSGPPREPAAAADASASATYCAGNWRPRSSLYHAHTHTRTHTCSLAR